jgi:hypothetical protein
MRLQKRPGGVTALAIINIVLGSLALLAGLCTVIALFVSQGMVQADPNAVAMERFLKDQLPLQAVMQWGGMAILLLQGIALLATGIGLLNMQNWARVTAIWFAIFSLLWILTQAVYYFAFTAPALERFFREVAAGVGPGPDTRVILQISFVIQIILWVFFVGYAAILIAILTRPSVREAFTSAARPEDDHDRFQDDEDGWDEKRRDRDDDDY